MDILYFGTVCDPERYERIINTCKYRPTVATVVFESALLEGFFQNGVKMEIHSFPMIPMFPKSKMLKFGGNVEQLPCGYKCRWLKTWNIPVLKQLSRRMDARRIMKKWCREHRGTGILLSYSIPPFMAGDMVRFGKKYGIKTIVIVPDLPANMYQNHKSNALINGIKSLYLNGAIKYQGKFDAYIYLAEAMADVVAPHKPYMVMEGILNASADDCSDTIKSPKRAVMYAGMLHEKYGVMTLVDAFQKANVPSTELWLFGSGTAVEEIQKIASKDARIRYFGRMSREEILKREKEATLLVNPRNVKDVFTKYSFPSKTIEYMYSGTPVLTTRLEGIPKEYFDYVYSVDDSDVLQMTETLGHILRLSDDELITKGSVAKQYIQHEKNAKAQVSRIVDFVVKLTGDKYEAHFTANK